MRPYSVHSKISGHLSNLLNLMRIRDPYFPSWLAPDSMSRCAQAMNVMRVGSARIAQDRRFFEKQAHALSGTLLAHQVRKEPRLKEAGDITDRNLPNTRKTRCRGIRTCGSEANTADGGYTLPLRNARESTPRS